MSEMYPESPFGAAKMTPIGYQGPAAHTWTFGCDGAHPVSERCAPGAPAAQPPNPEPDGTVIIGPGCFASEDRAVISWLGENYYRREAGQPVKPVVIVFDPNEASLPWYGDLAEAVHDQSGGRVVITSIDAGMSDAVIAIADRVVDEAEALSIWTAVDGEDDDEDDDGE